MSRLMSSFNAINCTIFLVDNIFTFILACWSCKKLFIIPTALLASFDIYSLHCSIFFILIKAN